MAVATVVAVVIAVIPAVIPAVVVAVVVVAVARARPAVMWRLRRRGRDVMSVPNEGEMANPTVAQARAVPRGRSALRVTGGVGALPGPAAGGRGDASPCEQADDKTAQQGKAKYASRGEPGHTVLRDGGEPDAPDFTGDGELLQPTRRMLEV